jgi:hypothetical protein
MQTTYDLNIKQKNGSAASQTVEMQKKPYLSVSPPDLAPRKFLQVAGLHRDVPSATLYKEMYSVLYYYFIQMHKSCQPIKC